MRCTHFRSSIRESGISHRREQKKQRKEDIRDTFSDRRLCAISYHVGGSSCLYQGMYFQFFRSLNIFQAELTRVKGKELPKYVQYLLEAYAQHGFEMSYKEPTVKVDAIIAIIRKIQQEYPGDKILIFSSYRSFIDILYWHLQKHFGKDILARYTGGMSRNRKAIELDRFKVRE